MRLRVSISPDRIAKNDGGICPIERLPARDIGTEVVGRVRAMLADPSLLREVAIAFEANNAGANPAEAAAAIANTEKAWGELFPAEQPRIFRILVQRVEVSTNGLTVAFRDSGIAALAKMLTDSPDDPANALPPSLPTPRGGSGFLEPKAFVPRGRQVVAPLRLMRRSGRKVVIPFSAPPMPAEQAEAKRTLSEVTPLALAVARGFRWRGFTLLAPDIIEAIMDSRELSGLSVDRLAVEELPSEWGDQRREFGFPEVG